MTVYPVNLRFTYYVESREKRSFYSVKVRLKKRIHFKIVAIFVCILLSDSLLMHKITSILKKLQVNCAQGPFSILVFG